jgi:hypothetical protein
MGGTASSPICSVYADCCNGFAIGTVNQTYAATHWYCYPDGHPPNYGTNLSNISTEGIIFNAPIKLGFNLTRQVLDYKERMRTEQEFIYQYRTVPYKLMVISGSISIAIIVIAMLIYGVMLLKQPFM